MNRTSKAALLLCYALMLYVALVFSPRWKKDGSEATISWDVSGYYMYLPALFIYKDLKHCGFKDSILAKYSPTPDFQQAIVHPSGNYVMKYSSGQAILMAPAFFIAHAIATHSATYPADGFSYPYQVSVGLLMLLYAFIGLYVLRKVLCYYFKDGTVALTLIAIVWGSNYLNYATVDQAMSHNGLFTLYALLLLCSIRFYRNPSYKYAVLIGCIAGLATLVRPTEIISLLVPLLWGVSSVAEAKLRLDFFRKKPVLLVVAGLCFALFVFIQPLYWKLVSGDWLVYSYRDEGFSFLHPYFKEYLFGPRSGWLRYTPMMLLAFLGLLPLIRNKISTWAIVLFFLLDLYIVASWDIWWYGGRAMVQSYPVVFFPVAALIEAVNRRKWLPLLLYPFYGLAIYLNLWWTYNAHAGNVQVIDISNEFYWEMAGRWHATEDDLKLLDNPDRYRGDTLNGQVIYRNDHPAQDTSNNGQVDPAATQQILLDTAHRTSPEFVLPLPGKTSKWIRAWAGITVVEKEWELGRMPQMVVRAYRDSQEVKSRMIFLHRFFDGPGGKDISIDFRLPDQPYDRLTLTFLNPSSTHKTLVGPLRVVAY